MLARVMAGLCEGRSPNDIADQQGVAISTVRAQIGAIRSKTGSPSIPALVRQLAVLPPLLGALRLGAMH
jgi:DNA-binding CsgD family transcriptional regulator